MAQEFIYNPVMTKLILIIEDEPDIVETLTYNLSNNGYSVRSALTGAEGLVELNRPPPPDLVLLDLMLPDISGNEICSIIRQSEQLGDIPIIMVTAKDEEMDRVKGLEQGADDYVVKPFAVRELMLRIKTILRRSNQSTVKRDTLEFGILSIDLQAHQVKVSKEPINLSSLEFRLLMYLYEKRGRVQSRTILLNNVWDIHSAVKTRTVDVHVKRLRTKLKQASDYIQTVRGFGYRFVTNPEEAHH